MELSNREDYSHFSVHVFLNHDPCSAALFLPELFDDFPDSLWRLPPVRCAPARPTTKPSRYEFVAIEPRNALGRYVLERLLPRSATIQELSEVLEIETGIERKYYGQFTVYPQYSTSYMDRVTIEKPQALAWNTTLWEVARLDKDIQQPEIKKISGHYAPVLHIVLETKPVVVRRMFGIDSMPKIFGGDHYLFLRDEWSKVDSFWHAHRDREPAQLQSYLREWRMARHAHAYHQKCGVNSTVELNLKRELEEKKQRLAEVERLLIQAKYGGDGVVDSNLSFEPVTLSQRITQIERIQNGGFQIKMVLSRYAAQWEQWVINHNYEDLQVRELDDGEVEERVKDIFCQIFTVVGEWNTSDRKKILLKAIDKEYYNNRPWAMAEEIAKEEVKRQIGYQENEREREREIRWAAQRQAYATTFAAKEREKAQAAEERRSTSPMAVDTRSFRLPDGKLSEDFSKFTLNSGILTYGQILPLYISSLTPSNLTSDASHIPLPLEGGTILQRRYTYRSAARNGVWKIRRYYHHGYYGENLEEPVVPVDTQMGWIIFHEDVNPTKIIERVRAIDGPGAVSLQNAHTDKNVLYINRYDWSYHFSWSNDERQFQEWAESAIGPVPSSTEGPVYCNVAKSGYLVVLDAEEFGLEFLNAYQRDCDPFWGGASKEMTFLRKDRGAFGAFMSMELTEYEFGWLVFSGEKHAEHDADELIAMVYDGSYEVMQSLYHAVEGEAS